MTNPQYGSKLLYRSATGLEKALADVDGGRITSIPAELIKDIWDPYACPMKFLPYLAWAFGVEYWNDEWSETTKRAWVANQLLFKSYRGTAAALKMAVDYAGRDVSRWGYEVVKITTQPQKIFSGPSLTREQREAWLSQLPQVRVFLTQEEGVASPYKSFYNASNSLRLHDRRFCLGGMLSGIVTSKASVSIPSDAITRLKRKARWVEHGVETDITVTDFGSYFQLHKSDLEDGKVFSNRPFSTRHFIPSSARDRLITIEPKSQSSWRSAATPTLQAVTSEPDLVKIDGLRKHSVFSNMTLGGFFAKSTAPLRIYSRYAVLDPSVKELRRTPVQFMGVGRFSFPAFTAWADVTVGNVISKFTSGFGFYLPKAKFFIPHDGTPLAQVRLAAQASKALRDKIMVRSGPQQRFLAGGKPILADIDSMLAS
jgi:phage tail P2-like protein